MTLVVVIFIFSVLRNDKSSEILKKFRRLKDVVEKLKNGLRNQMWSKRSKKGRLKVQLCLKILILLKSSKKFNFKVQKLKSYQKLKCSLKVWFKIL